MASENRNRVARRTYKNQTPGKISGNIGGEAGTITVGEDGTFSTTNRNEQLFVENALGWEGTEETSESPSKAKE